MAVGGVFMEKLDLSLQTCPPNSAAPSSSISDPVSISNPTDLCVQNERLKSHSEGSSQLACYPDTNLTLSHPVSSTAAPASEEAESPWRQQPIRGIPIYNHNPNHHNPFPFLSPVGPKIYHQFSASGYAGNFEPSQSPSPTFLQQLGSQGSRMSVSTPGRTNGSVSHHPNMMGFMSRMPVKRSLRAPRMRWTSMLHARFVRAVELLGGHESKCIACSA